MLKLRPQSRPALRKLSGLSAIGLCLGVLLAGCSEPPRPRRPAEIREQIVRMLPGETRDRQGWAADIQTAFSALEIPPTSNNLCAVLAVTEQESSFTADPAVPGLAKIARAEIERRAARFKVPSILVRAALRLDSANGKSYGERLDAVRTERQLNQLFEEFIDSVPMGRRLLDGSNPVHTGGPMQVSIAFAEQHARRQPYPYPLTGTIRQEVFTRRGGMYFGIAHLLGYRASYTQPLHRFADFNAGFHASRNAAFQHAVGVASGMDVAMDGDLVRFGKSADGSKIGSTEAAVRSIAPSLELSHAQIRRALEKGNRLEFEDTRVYRRVFALAEQVEGRELPRAAMPRIDLKSPKITRKLTTEWFATRVDNRYKRCLARDLAQDSNRPSR